MRRTRVSAGLLVLSVLLLGCDKKRATFDHAEEHPEGHDHHEENHGHESAMVRITEWNRELELFAEHSPAVAGKENSLLAHLTVLDGFKPLERAELELELEGPASLRARSEKALRPGIFRLPFTPQKAGEYRGRLVVKGSFTSVIDGISLRAFDSEQALKHAAPEEDHDGLVELLKEQQWGVPFATAFAQQGSLVASIEVAGSVATPPDGSAEVGAPVAGRIVAPARGLPRPGDAVKKGQVLASLSPAPSSPEEAARASLTMAEAEARAAAAGAALERAERLIKDEAIAERELEDARREARVAKEAVRAAERARQLFSGASGTSAGAWQLSAPIAGTLTQVLATPGASVSMGERLFRIVDERELWIRARVPEQDAARLVTDRDAHYQVAGLSDWKLIDVDGGDAGAGVVIVGRTVDPVSRTVDVIYSLREPDRTLRVGGLLQVSLPVGDEFSGVVVPRAAIVDDEGREVVYVQVDGEHFLERLVKTGPRSGELVGIEHGLRAGERVVVRGAHFVKLADRPDSVEPHGHVH